VPTIHLDSASGLPLSDTGRAALLAALERGWADPRRLYHDGRVARQLLDAARSAVATVLGCQRDGVIFTASGTEAAILGMRGLAREGSGLAREGSGRPAARSAAVVGAVEHSAVLAGAEAVSCGEPTIVPVTGEAVVDSEKFGAAVARPGVRVAAMQQVNPEIGTIQPVGQAHLAARAAGVPLLVDACAGLALLGPPPAWDALVGSAHKWGGPAGVGVLALAPGVRWDPPAGSAETGFPNVPAVVAAAAALEDAVVRREQARAHCRVLSDRLRRALAHVAPDVAVLGPADPAARADHIVAATVLYADADVLVSHLDRCGFAVASGSACTSDTRRPSHVLVAMGAITHGNVRFSVSQGVTIAEVDALIQALSDAIAAARAGTGWSGND
jgi:cysteine desulfurase